MIWQQSIIFLGTLLALGNAASLPRRGEEHHTAVDLMNVTDTVYLGEAPEAPHNDTEALFKRAPGRQGVRKIYAPSHLPPERLHGGRGLWAANHVQEKKAYYSLYDACNPIVDHHREPLEDSAFVIAWESLDLVKRMVHSYPERMGWVYEIARYSNLVNVDSTLKQYSGECGHQAYAALDNIPFEQIVGWHEIKKTSQYIKETGPLRNNLYNAAKYRDGKDSGAQFPLAGFSKDHHAWLLEPWKGFEHGQVHYGIDRGTR